MRKLILFICIFVFLCFFIPVIFTRTKKIEKTAEIDNINKVIQEEEKYTYQNYGTVRLLHKETGEVQELSMDEYLYRSCCCRNACKF